MKFRKVKNKEEWRSLTNKTTIRKMQKWNLIPEGKPYEVYNGKTMFEWFSTLEEAKAFASSNFMFNR